MTIFELVFLGTAGSIPTEDRNLSAIALKRKREVFLFDAGEDVQRRLDRHIESILGSDSKSKDNEVEQISKAFLKRNNAEVIDEIDIVKKIETMENEIDEFENEIDLCLSEKNSQTYIEV